MPYQHVKHPWGPLYDANSQILILGSFPSPKSRENNFFYGHPQNRFWKVLSSIYDERLPLNIEEKKALLKRNHIALWDVIDECDIEGASDASIKNAVPTRLSELISGSNIRAVFCNGARSYDMYCRYQLADTGIPAVKLPSTSPANAACSFDRLLAAWQQALLGLN